MLVVLLRATLAFFTLLIMARLMGKTQISQLTFFDYATGITIGSIAASMSIDTNIQTVHAIAGILVWTGLAIAMDALVLKNIPALKIIQGEPTVIIRNGKLMEDAMKRTHYNIEELMAQLRGHRIFDLAMVQEAVLETNGKLSVLTKPEESAPTRKDLHIGTETMGRYPVVLMVDGNIAHHRLDSLGLNEDWLREALKKQGIEDLHNVMVAQLGTSGELYVDVRKDWEVEQSGVV
ncbi:MAG: DUF421 domain-containing protein [Syntrophomonadaceae bacterium]